MGRKGGGADTGAKRLEARPAGRAAGGGGGTALGGFSLWAPLRDGHDPLAMILEGRVAGGPGAHRHEASEGDLLGRL